MSTNLPSTQIQPLGDLPGSSNNSPFRLRSDNSQRIVDSVRDGYSLKTILLSGERLDPNSWESQISRNLQAESKVPCMGSGVRVPFEVFQRDLSFSGGIPTGAGFVENKVRPAADVLRPFAACVAAGATVLPDLRSNVYWPRVATGTGPVFIAENANSYMAGSGYPTFSTMVLSGNHRLVDEIRISTMLVKQAQFDVEKLITTTILRDVGAIIDFVAINGDPAVNPNQPKGLLNLPQNTSLTSDYNALAAGTTFGGPATWSALVEGIETSVFSQNVIDDGTVSWIVSPQTRGRFMTVPKISGFPSYLMESDGSIGGYRSFTTSNLSSTNQVVFGRFSDLVIGIFGGGIELLSDPFRYAGAGQIRIVVSVLIDVNVLHGPALTCSLDAANQ
jgi:hypothetical protein